MILFAGRNLLADVPKDERVATMNRYSAAFLACLALPPALGADDAAQPGGDRLSSKARLGRALFFDTNLSTPPGQSCGSCHDPKAMFTDPDRDEPTSEGALPELKGSVNMALGS